MAWPGFDLFKRARGIARSLAIYHGIPGRSRRLRRFYRELLSPGELGFDIGAHVGSRTRAWRKLGARVVAVEPQPDCLVVLRWMFRRDQGVTIEPVAVGARPGRIQLRVSTATPTVSTMSQDWMGTVSRDHRFAKVKWDKAVDVEVTTLDDLIARHGEPAFCKIDVEGFEVEVLKGLSKPLRSMSFEYLPQSHDQALEALRLVEELGSYRYNYSPVETMRLISQEWLDADQLARVLDRAKPRGRSGDVYARLTSSDEAW